MIPSLKKMKKYNTSDFSRKQQPLYADENEIFYDEVKTSLEETWEKLSEKNIADLGNEQKELQADRQFLATFLQSKVELETCMTTFKLVNDKIIDAVKIKHTINKNMKEEIDNQVFLRKKMIKDAVNILDEQIEILDNSIKKERRVYENLKEYDMFISDTCLNVWIDKSYFLSLNQNEELISKEELKPMGVVCKIKYKDFVFSCFNYKNLVSDNLDTVENLKRYIKEKNIEGIYKEGVIQIDVTQNSEKDEEIAGENNNSAEIRSLLSIFVVEAFLDKCNMDHIFECCLIYIANYFVKNFIKGLGFNYQEFNKIEYNGKVLIDGSRENYFLAKKNHKIKILRDNKEFKMIYNGKEVNSLIV